MSRIAPAAVRNEAYTWAITAAVGSSAAAGAVAGVIVDQPGGTRWAFLVAGALVALAATVAALPNGPLRRATPTECSRFALAAGPGTT